jgi:glycosyltransferase involved in cell wall biosynthesis
VVQRSMESPHSGVSPRLSLSIVIPAKNEANRLPRTLQHVLSYVRERGWDAEIIVVNDGSTDGTSDVVRQFVKADPSVMLIENIVNSGKGSAIRDGMLRATGDIVLFTDADDSTPIEEAEKVIQGIVGGADIVIGSRWVDRKLQTTPQPWYRRLNGRIYNLTLRTTLGLSLTDTQNGFKAFTRKAAKSSFAIQRIPGWGFDAESLFLANKLGFKVVEVPVEYVYYSEGSKIRPYRDGAKMLLELLLVRWHFARGAYHAVLGRQLATPVALAARAVTDSQAHE